MPQNFRARSLLRRADQLNGFEAREVGTRIRVRGIMTPPSLRPAPELMQMTGERTGRYWMAIDPDAPKPSLAAVLWLFALVLGVVAFTALVHSGR